MRWKLVPIASASEGFAGGQVAASPHFKVRLGLIRCHPRESIMATASSPRAREAGPQTGVVDVIGQQFRKGVDADTGNHAATLEVVQEGRRVRRVVEPVEILGVQASVGMFLHAQAKSHASSPRAIPGASPRGEATRDVLILESHDGMAGSRAGSIVPGAGVHADCSWGLLQVTRCGREGSTWCFTQSPS
jgi:hypothetical protein